MTHKLNVNPNCRSVKQKIEISYLSGIQLWNEGSQIVEQRIYLRGKISRLASQCHGGTQKKRQTEGMPRLQRPQ